ncbi:hypothetical protein BD770DRAFT_315833 [Pilaira anomala]|nr:hypothetical protein BD770DRAFT_315833 [Pilaira anomala]
MKTAGLPWTSSEYNEYFIAKLFQSQYDDILNLFKQDFALTRQKLGLGSFHVILATYVQIGQLDEAIQFIKNADKWDVVPDISVFVRTMNRCMPKNSTTVRTAKELIKTHGLSSTKALNTNLLSLFKENRSPDSQFQEIQSILRILGNKKLDVTTYNILITGFCDQRLPAEAVKIYKEMRTHDVKPNIYICSSLMEIFTHHRDVASAEQIVRDTILGGHKPDEVLYNQLIKVYFKARQSEKAFRAFQEVEKNPTLQVNDVMLNTMINGLVMNRELHTAGALYSSMMKSKFKPDMITFNTMLKGYVKANDMVSAQKIITDMFQCNMEPDTVTYTTLIDSVFMRREPTSTEEVIDYIKEMKIKPNVYTYNAIINNWVKRQDMEQAENTFHYMFGKGIPPTIHTYTNLIQGYTQLQDLNKVIETFKSMSRHGIKPDRATFNFLIVGFLHHHRLQDAYNCLEQMKASKLTPTKDTAKLLLDDCLARKDWNMGQKIISFMDSTGFSGLFHLPNELILYLLENFLDLADLWQLFQTSSELRYFSSTVIGTIWKIETRPKDQMKIQCRAALISLIDQQPKDYDKIIQGIRSYKHKYVLIEDIDIRNRIRTTVDIIFHHAVFISAIRHSNSCQQEDRLTSPLVKLLCQLDTSFPSYCREITYTLADNIKAFLEYTGYKILASSCTTITFYRLSALFDLMGAAFGAKILTDSHLDCAVQRTLELLSNHPTFKKKLLLHLLDHWLNVKVMGPAADLCRYIRLEIDKCDDNHRSSTIM